RYREAELLCKRALRIYEKAFGKDHPETASCINNLAYLYQAQGRRSEAEPLHKRALDISEKTLGKNHPATARSPNNLPALTRDQGRYAEAEPLYRRAIAIAEVTLEPEHPDALIFLEGYIALLHKMKSEDEAVKLEPRVKAIRGKQVKQKQN